MKYSTDHWRTSLYKTPLVDSRKHYLKESEQNQSTLPSSERSLRQDRKYRLQLCPHRTWPYTKRKAERVRGWRIRVPETVFRISTFLRFPRPQSFRRTCSMFTLSELRSAQNKANRSNLTSASHILRSLRSLAILSPSTTFYSSELCSGPEDFAWRLHLQSFVPVFVTYVHSICQSLCRQVLCRL